MKKYSLCVASAISLSLVACGGGGGGGSSSGGGGTTPTAALVPLNITMKDLSNNTIPYIDIYKNNSHTQYKLNFTNPNSVAVTPPQQSFLTSLPDFGVDVNWVAANNESAMPGLYSASDAYTKTKNADDCFNLSEIPAGGSCSFYTTAFNALNTTEQTEFSYPISYSISQTGLPAGQSNSLSVQQCFSYQVIIGGQYVTKYDCSNETKPGFANQFITYKLNSTPTTIPDIGASRSIDGNWIYTCQGLNCGKYAVNYDTNTNVLSDATSSSYNFVLPKSLTAGAGDPLQYVTFNGSNMFFVGYDSTFNWQVINSTNPNKFYAITDIGLNQPGVSGIVGLDNSFWVQPIAGKATASFYDLATDSFIPTNLNNDNSQTSEVLAVDANGTVISYIGGTYMCSRTQGSPLAYVSVPIKNYTLSLTTGGGIFTMSSGVYAYMNVPNLVTGRGTSLSPSAAFKIHTENGLCEIRLDDYISTVNGLFTTYGSYGFGFGLTQASNIYTGL